MKIKINGQTHNIPRADQLSTDAYIKFMATETKNIYDYITCALGLPRADLLRSTIEGNIDLLAVYIGEILNPLDTPDPLPAAVDFLAKNGVIVNRQKFWQFGKRKPSELNLVMHRILFQQKAKREKDPYKLCLFVLAMGLNPGCDDFETLDFTANCYGAVPYQKAVGAGAFFLRSSQSGLRSEAPSLMPFKKRTRMRMLWQSKMQALQDWAIMVSLTKSPA